MECDIAALTDLWSSSWDHIPLLFSSSIPFLLPFLFPCPLVPSFIHIYTSFHPPLPTIPLFPPHLPSPPFTFSSPALLYFSPAPFPPSSPLSFSLSSPLVLSSFPSFYISSLVLLYLSLSHPFIQLLGLGNAVSSRIFDYFDSWKHVCCYQI